MKRRGFSLLETLIVIALIGGAVAIIATRSAAASRDQRRSDYVQGMQIWMDSVRTTYSSQGFYTGATAADLRALAPPSWQRATTVVPRIGGVIAAAPVTYLSLPGGAVQMTHTTLPRVDCGAVAFDLRDELNTLTINSTVLKSTSSAVFTRAAADTACGLSSNTLIGVFK